MFRGILATHAESRADVDDCADLVRPRGTLDAAAQVDIYAEMYCAHLTDTLAED